MSKALELLEEARMSDDQRSQAAVLAEILLHNRRDVQVIRRGSDAEFVVEGAHKPVRCPRSLILEAVRENDPDGKISESALRLLGSRPNRPQTTNRRSTKHRANNGGSH